MRPRRCAGRRSRRATQRPRSKHHLRMPILPTVNASITLSSDAEVDLSVITERTGLEPSQQPQMKGRDRFSPSGRKWPRPARRSQWTLSIGGRPTLDLQAVLDELLDLVERQADVLNALAAELNLEMTVELHIHMEQGQAPDGSLSRPSLIRVARLGADLCLDLYPGNGSAPAGRGESRLTGPLPAGDKWHPGCANRFSRTTAGRGWCGAHRPKRRSRPGRPDRSGHDARRRRRPQPASSRSRELPPR